MKRFSCFLVLTVLSATSSSQQLHIGDKVPDIYFASIMNDVRTSGKLSGFQKKLTILEFWGTGCKACIEGFPHLDELQAKFQKDLQILPVARESTDSVNRFLAKRRKIRLPSMPIITSDTILNKFFPHVGVPLLVWIDSTSTVRHITNGYNATAQNIGNFLTGKTLQMQEVEYKSGATYESLLDLIAERRNDLKFSDYSILTNTVPGIFLHNGLLYDGKGEANRVAMSGDFLNLIEFAFNEGNKYEFSYPNSIQIRCKDSFRLKRPADSSQFDHWRRDNAFYYELGVKESSKLYSSMQKDLQRRFGIVGRIEMQNRPHLVLRIADARKIPVSTHKDIRINFYTISADTVKFAEGLPFEVLPIYLKIQIKNNTDRIFTNEAKCDAQIDVRFPARILEDWDLEALRKILFNYGLVLIEEQRLAPVLIVE